MSATHEVHRNAEIAEVRTLLRWAAGPLNKTERAALAGFLAHRTDPDIARELGITRGGVWMARQSAIRKLRRRMQVLRVERISEVLSA